MRNELFLIRGRSLQICNGLFLIKERETQIRNVPLLFGGGSLQIRNGPFLIRESETRMRNELFLIREGHSKSRIHFGTAPEPECAFAKPRSAYGLRPACGTLYGRKFTKKLRETCIFRPSSLVLCLEKTFSIHK